MASVLCITNGLPGILHSSLELARRLQEAGHDVEYATFAPACETASAQGLQCHTLEAGRYEAFLDSDRRFGVIRRMGSLRERQTEAMATLPAGDLIRLLDRVDPDLLLIDGEMHAHIIAASNAQIPLALLNTFASIWRQPGVPPPHHQVRPGVGWKGSRFGTSVLWWELRTRKRLRAWLAKVRDVGCDRLTLFRRLARQHDFDFEAETDSTQWLIPFTYRRFPVLSLHAREFEFPHSAPSHVRYVGPMVPSTRVDDRVAPATLETLELVIKRHREAAGRRKLIYAGFGSIFSANIELVRRLVEVVGLNQDWEMVLALGDQPLPPELYTSSANVHVLPWVPQLEVLPHTDLAVTHGGINTIDECVLNGVPMLIYCGSQTDMAGNTARVVHHGIGLAGDPDRDTVQDIRRHMQKLLAEEEFHRNIQRLNASYRAYAETGVAEQAVASLIQQHA